MCFGRSWSLASFSVLAVSVAVCMMNKAPWQITVAVVYLALKEMLQLHLYNNIDSCSETNKSLTTLSWVHISFQPVFMNLFISAFSKHKELYNMPVALSLIFGIANMMRIKEVRGNINYPCKPNDNKQINMCRPQTCSYMGKYHVAYGFELASADAEAPWTPSIFTFYLLMFAPAFILGDWQLASINLSVALASSHFLSHDAGEAAAVWCLNSFWIGFAALYYVMSRNYR